MVGVVRRCWVVEEARGEGDSELEVGILVTDVVDAEEDGDGWH